MHEDYRFTWFPFEPAPYSPVRALAGTSMSSEDFYGMARPATDSKKSYGAIQYTDVSRDTTTTYDSSTASIKLSDAGRHQMWLKLPPTQRQHNLSCYIYREADYAGTAPQVSVYHPSGNHTYTDSGSASAWNELSGTFSPDSVPQYVVIELVSNNTATSGNYAVYFEDIAIT